LQRGRPFSTISRVDSHDEQQLFTALVDSRRTPAEREALPLGSDAFKREVDRQVRETLARYEGKRRRASS
jgi:hypothetical protein